METGGDGVEDGARSLPAMVYRLARRAESGPLLILDGVILGLAYVLAIFGGYEGELPPGALDNIGLLIGVPVAMHLITFRLVGLYDAVWRHASVTEAIRMLIGTIVAAVLSGLALSIISELRSITVPALTAPAIAAILTLVGCGGVRFQSRLLALERSRWRADAATGLIVGVDDAGVRLLEELRTVDGVGIVGFVALDPKVVGRRIRNVPVLATVDDLGAVAEAHGVDRIFVALPDLDPERRRAIVLAALAETNAQVKVVGGAPRGADEPLVRTLRDIDVEDLLHRPVAPIDTELVADCLRGSTVLVTGAGGSIGSEIARQVAAYEPAALVLLDRDETLLHELSQAHTEATPVLVDIRSSAEVRRVFRLHRPDVVFHAAALKHVPVLETHPILAIETNLLATRQLATIAAESGCRRLVNISTDKAANPCSIMGATKRAAELAVEDVARQHSLPYASVRFGNVLGSRGSVVPTFLQQILDGGPVKVTDPAMNRYFMSISEAVGLVLHAGSSVSAGQRLVLRMGEPVRIVDLAEQMIRLAGLRPGVDIDIDIVGVRPGERITEQLTDDSELVDDGTHPSISVIRQRRAVDADVLDTIIDTIADACNRRSDVAAVGALEHLLHRSGVPTELGSRVPDTIDLRTARHHTRLPALLGGQPAFPEGQPFARPASPPLDAVIDYLTPSYEQGALTNGPLVRDLEERIAERLGIDHVVAVSSCTSGLVLTLQALVRRVGDVLMPSFTFSASGHAVMWNRMVPRFAECDPLTFNLDVHDADLRADGISAVLATHVFGTPADTEAIEALGTRHRVPVVFDAAHALGARAGDRAVGTFGDAEVFSLTPTKVLVAGEGGLVATRHADVAAHLRMGRDYGNPGDYDTRFVGLNARMSEFHAATALASLDRFDANLERRRAIAARYTEGINAIAGVRVQRVEDVDASTYKDFTIAIDGATFGLTRNQVAMALGSEGVDTRSYFSPPVHRQRAYASLPLTNLPVTDEVSSSVISLPIYPDMADDAVDRIIDVLAAIHAHASELADHADLLETRLDHPTAHPIPYWRRHDRAASARP